MNVIGIEASTSAAKGVLFSSSEGIVATDSISFPDDTSDIVTQDPEGLWNTVLEVLTRIAKRNGSRIEAIGLGGIWHSLLLLDGKRRPLGRIRTWAETGAAGFVELLRNQKDLVNWYYQRTGCMVHAMYPIWKICYLKEQQATEYQKARFISSQLEYLFEKLTGKYYISKCTASGSGFLNIHQLDWDQAILDQLGLQREQLGELKEATVTAPLLPEVAAETGLPGGIPVTVGCADGALNQVGIGGIKTGIMTASIGTSAAIRMVQNKPQLPEAPSTWCYYLHENHWLSGAAIHAGNNLDWFMEHFNNSAQTKQYDYNRYLTAIGEIESFKAPYFMPFIYGERCPGWREKRTGGFLGLDRHHCEADLFYAVLEGILFNLYQCYLKLIESKTAPNEIRISGGITNSPYWLQLAADIFGRELSITGLSNDSTMGAALFALKAAGGIENLEEYQPVITGRVIPRPQFQEILQPRFEQYLEYYRKL